MIKIKGVVIGYRIDDDYQASDRYEVFIFKSAVRRWFFQQDLNGFEPNRAYKILLKTEQSNGQTVIHDEDF